jgi:hypothetical protein
MKYANQCLVTRAVLITIVPLLTVPLPAMAVKIHGAQAGTNVSLGNNTLTSVTGNGNTAIGWEALKSNTRGSSNTAIGYEALDWNTTGNNNTATGHQALAHNTTGANNTASGVAALGYNTEGSHNTANGAGALYANQTGIYNSAIGYKTLSQNRTGNYNTAIGSEALMENTEGHSNTASGLRALHLNTKGYNNTASGRGALLSNTEGHNNTATGAETLTSNDTGSYNTATGHRTLQANIRGDNNTAIGYGAGGQNITGSNNVFIGFQAGDSLNYQTKSNKLVVGNGGSKENELITGDFAANTVNINGDLHASGNLTQNSDGRLKKDIKPLTQALDSILKLQGKTYRWKEDTTFANKADIGLVAQEVEQIFPELVAENEQGYKGIAYSKLTAVLIEAIKEQQGQMTTQQDQIASLEKENTQLKALVEGQMEALLARVAMLEGESLAAN